MRFLRNLFSGKPPKDTEAASHSAETKKSKPIQQTSTSVRKPVLSRARVVTELKDFPFPVVGESHYQDALEKIARGYRRESQALTTNAVIALDPENRFDPNAVRVEIDSRIVGYLPATESKRIGGLMRAQGVETATVEAQVRGGWRTNQHDQGFLGVRLKMPRSGWVDFGVGAKKPDNLQVAETQPSRRNSAPEPATDGPLVGQWVALWGFSRDGDVAQEIAAAGGRIMAGIGKSTTMVVRDGNQITPSMRSSATWRKFEELRTNGRNIEMVTWPELKGRLDNVESHP